MFKLEEKIAVAVILEKGLLPLSKPVVFFNHVDVRENNVMIPSKSVMTTYGRLKEQCGACVLGNYLGKKICSKSGKEYGRVYDIIIHLYTGQVEAVEATDGILQDAYHGRKLVPFLDQVEFAEEMIVLDKVSEEEMSSAGGLKDMGKEI